MGKGVALGTGAYNFWVPRRTNVNLVFSHIHPTRSQKAVGPYNVIRLGFDGMRAEDAKVMLAPYRNHQWSLDGLEYFRVDCTDPVVIHFERERERSGRYGPYERFSAVNGLAYGDDTVVAFLNVRINEWLYYDSGYHWPVMVISDRKSVH